MSDISETNQNVQLSSAHSPLAVTEKISYGLGDAGGTIITGLISNFLTFFYTDIFGLTPAIVGTLCDSVNEKYLSIRYGIFDEYEGGDCPLVFRLSSNDR